MLIYFNHLYIFPQKIHLFRVVMNELIKILIAEVFKRKCFTDTFTAKPGVTTLATNMLKTN